MSTDRLHIENDAASPFVVQQGNALLIPYGKYAHPEGLQIVDRAAGEEMRANFKKAPIYPGHPDVPNRPDSNPSAPAVGWIDGITLANEGLYLPCRWNAEGAAAIRNAAYRFYSPFWECKKVAGGIRPVFLRSLGLTNNPRFEVPAIANDASDFSSQRSLKRREVLEAVAAQYPNADYGARFAIAMNRAPQLFK